MNSIFTFGEHKNFKYGQRVRIQHTNSRFDSLEVEVVGIASRGIIDMYIVQFYGLSIKTTPDGERFSCFILSEYHLDSENL